MKIRALPPLQDTLHNHVIFALYSGATLISYDAVEIGSAEFARKVLEAQARRRDYRILCGCQLTLPGFNLRNLGGEIKLCCNPNTKALHAPDCRYHEYDDAYPQGPAAGTERTPKLGDLLTSLSMPRRIPLTVHAATPRSRPARKPTRKWRSTRGNSLSRGMLSLMHAARTNEYHPGIEVRPEDLLGRLKQALSTPAIDGVPQRAFVMGSGGNPQLNEIRENTDEQVESIQPVTLIGEIVGVQQAGNGNQKIMLHGSALTIEISEKQWSYAQTHGWSRATKQAVRNVVAGDQSTRIFAVLHVSVSSEDTLVAHRVGLVVTSERGIPVESLFELQYENHLVEAKRRFLKPILHSNPSRYMHDFVLLDTERPFFIEVNGMKHPLYKAHKALVDEYLEENFPSDYLTWWAVLGESFPDLPPVAVDCWHQPGNVG